jgi:hypothetical protein
MVAECISSHEPVPSTSPTTAAPRAAASTWASVAAMAASGPDARSSRVHQSVESAGSIRVMAAHRASSRSIWRPILALAHKPSREVWVVATVLRPGAR